MPPSRPVWSGHVRLSLVSFAVKLYPATSSTSKLSFHQVHEPSGKRIRYEKVVPGIGPVDKDEIVKGYEVEKGNYVLLTQEEIDEVKIEARKTLELVQFVEACEIDPIYFDRPYYVVPDDEVGEDAFRVLRDALRRSEKVGLGQLVMRGREYIGALKPCSRGLMLETLRFEDELRRADPYFSEIADSKPDGELLSLAEELIERKTRPFEAETFKDSYSQALKTLVEKKAKGRKATVAVDEEEAPSGEVIDLMAALKQSLGDGKGGRARSGGGSSRKASGNKPSGRQSSGNKSSSTKSSGTRSSGTKSSGGKSRSRSKKAA